VKLDARAVELLDAIRAHPDDDAPRLVFADLIADRWPAHSAWIVAQCSGKDSPDLHAAFLAELPPFLRHVTTRRGFVERSAWDLGTRDLRALDADDLLRLGPEISKVVLNAVGAVGELDAIAERLRRFEALAIHTQIPEAYARAFAAHPGFAQLRSLSIASTGITMVISALVRTTSFVGLERLRLDSIDHIAARALRSLAKAPFAGSLRELDVSDNQIHGLAGILRVLPGLRELGAGGTPIDADFATLPHRFERLSLDDCRLTDQVASLIADAGIVSQLVALHARSNRWTSQGFARFIERCGPLREVAAGERSWATGAHVGAALVKHRDSLETLQLFHGFGAAGLRAFAACDFPRLRVLSIVEDTLGDGLDALAHAPFLPRLRALFLTSRIPDRVRTILQDKLGARFQST
jgi:uncharacterized protein (TIGR02996 family)